MTAAHYRDSVVASISGYYKPVPSASVYVYAPGTTTQVTCYSDAATTIPLTQPLTADGKGVLDFYLPAERSVDFLVSGTGIVSSTISNVVVSSPDTLWTGGLTIQGGGETITAGGLTVTAGGLTLSAGNILFTDNTQDIGASGGSRPRNIYQAGGTFQSYNPGSGIANDGTNYERMEQVWSGNVTFLQTNASGAGVRRPMVINGNPVYLRPNNLGAAWLFNGAGHLLAETDNAFDIGASGATRPRNVYVAQNVFAGTNLQANTSVLVTSGFATNVGIQLNSAGSYVYSGTGVPANGTGNDGDFYFRKDGGAGTSIYQRRTGAWVATGA